MTESAQTRREAHHRGVTLSYQRVFTGSDGEAVLADLRSAFGIDLPAFLPLPNNARDAYSPFYAAIRDGQRQVWLHIQSKLGANVQPDGNDADARVTVRTGLSENGQ